VFFCDCIIVCVTIQPLAAIQINHLSIYNGVSSNKHVVKAHARL